MKKIKFLFFLFFILLSDFALCQFSIYNDLEISKNNIEKLNKRLLKVLMRDTVLSDSNNYEFIHIHRLILHDIHSVITPEDLLSRNFVGKVTHSLLVFKNLLKKEEYLDTYSRMLNKENQILIASGNVQVFRNYPNRTINPTLKNDMDFISIVKKNDIVLLFSIHWMEPTFALNKYDELCVIRENEEKKLEVISLEYFLEHYYECWWDPLECWRREKTKNNE